MGFDPNAFDQDAFDPDAFDFGDGSSAPTAIPSGTAVVIEFRVNPEVVTMRANPEVVDFTR